MIILAMTMVMRVADYVDVIIEWCVNEPCSMMASKTQKVATMNAIMVRLAMLCHNCVTRCSMPECHPLLSAIRVVIVICVSVTNATE